MTSPVLADEERNRTVPRVLIWNEGRAERTDPRVAQTYPGGIHAALQAGLARHGLSAVIAQLDEPAQGLSAARLDATDVLIWWGHLAHEEVCDTVVEQVIGRVQAGMGLIVLHSAHHSKVFRTLMGTTCDIKWREAGELERVWTVNPQHPIARDVPSPFEIRLEEMYGEPFDVPAPAELVFVSWFEGGEVFRSGMCYERGLGRIFFLRAGHETFPTYHHPAIKQILANAVRWAAPGVDRVAGRA